MSSSIHQIIPLELLFQHPEARLAKLSPSGRALIYLKRFGSLEQLILRDLHSSAETCIQVISHYMMSLEWSAQGTHLFYTMDQDGNENFRLYVYDLLQGKETCLTLSEHIYVKNLVTSAGAPFAIAFEMNADDPYFYHPYRYDLQTGELRQLETEKVDIDHFIFDEKLELIGREAVDDKGIRRLYMDDRTDPVICWQLSDGVLPRVLRVYGSSVYYLSPNPSGFLSLYVYDRMTQSTTLLYDAKDYDLEYCHFSESQKTCVSVSYFDYFERNVCLLSDYRGTFEALDSQLAGKYNIASASHDFKTLILHQTDEKGLMAYYLFMDEQLLHLFDTNPALRHQPLATYEEIRLTARDGVVIEGYMLRPLCCKEGPLPLVINVHGGPWFRETIEYINAEAQWFQNRGYATLNINFRGSTGYGTTFLNLGNKQWGQTMHMDLIDAAKWAVDQGIADAERIAIYGMSYGGYSVLAGLAFTPEFFCCGVDRVGPSDLVFIMEGLPPSWSALREGFYYRVGHPVHDREMLEAYSPIRHIDKITKPLMIAQGYNDPRVKFTESENVVAELKGRDVVCEYHCYMDEGHVFTKQSNIFHFYHATEDFLKRYL